jgi:translation initiation factor IF-1
MLFGETVAVHCENHTEHTNTLCGQNAEFWYVNTVRTSQETHYVSATKPSRLIPCRKRVAVYCENHTEHTDTSCGQNAEFWYVNTVLTSQETHYVSAAKTNRLMLFGETVAVYCENHTEHTDTLCGQNAEFWYVNTVLTSQETYYVSAAKPNRLMLFGETAAVYCENHTEHTDTLCGHNVEFQHVKAGGTCSNQ